MKEGREMEWREGKESGREREGGGRDGWKVYAEYYVAINKYT